jgi:hypothetical protein
MKLESDITNNLHHKSKADYKMEMATETENIVFVTSPLEFTHSK